MTCGVIVDSLSFKMSVCQIKKNHSSRKFQIEKSNKGVTDAQLARWRISEELSFGHLLAITSLSNTIVSLPALTNEERQNWSHLMTLHCVMLGDKIEMIAPRIESLARRWSDRLAEVREAAQSLLLDRLRRIDQNGLFSTFLSFELLFVNTFFC